MYYIYTILYYTIIIIKKFYKDSIVVVTCLSPKEQLFLQIHSVNRLTEYCAYFSLKKLEFKSKSCIKAKIKLKGQCRYFDQGVQR